MARAAKKAAAKTTGNLTHDNTKNALTDDEIKALTLQHVKKYKAALAAKKAAAAAFLNATKLAKAELGDHAIKDIKDLIAIEENENAEADAKAELERKMRIYRWAGLPMGYQGDMFAPDIRPLAERSYEEGKTAGLAGEACRPPHDAGSEAHQEYVRGWHEGQAALASMIKKKEAVEAPLVAAAADEADGGADEFDEAADDTAEPEGEAERAAVDDGAPWPDDADVAAVAAEREPAEAI